MGLFSFLLIYLAAGRVCTLSSSSGDVSHELRFLLSSDDCDEVILPSHANVVSGPLNVTSNTIFTVEGNLTSLSADKESEWPVLSPLKSYPTRGARYQPFLFAVGTNITIRGSTGVVNGAGETWWRNKSLRAERPRLIAFEMCRECVLRDLRIEFSAFWTIHIVFSSSVLVENVNVFNPVTGANTDGCDPDSSENVTIRASTIETADDCISVKAGLIPVLSAQNILVENCTFKRCGGLAIGSEVAGGVSNVVFSGCKLSEVDNVVRLKSKLAVGGSMNDILFQDLDATKVVTGIFANVDYESKGGGPPSSGATRWGNITVTHVKMDEVYRAASIQCSSTIPCGHFELDHVEIKSLFGFDCSSNVNGTSISTSPKPCF